jgi:hypothetical protein
MTQPEPTRDPQLLSAEQLANCKAMYGQHGDVQKLLAHIAAQDQRHAALVDAAKAVAEWHELPALRPAGTFGHRLLALQLALAALAQPPGDE